MGNGVNYKLMNFVLFWNRKIVTTGWTYSSNGWSDVHTELCGKTYSKIVT